MANGVPKNATRMHDAPKAAEGLSVLTLGFE
jgi:hypothetical protein